MPVSIPSPSTCPPMPRQIPEEILAMILVYVMHAAPENPRGIVTSRNGRTVIAPLARVSPVWRAEVERLLYDHITLSGPFNIVRCFKTIAYGCRGVGKYVKCLHIALQDYDTSSSRTRGSHTFYAVTGSGDDGRLLLMGFARLVRDALFSMKQLTSYNLSIAQLPRPIARIIHENKFATPFLPLDAPFKLQSFSCMGLSLNAPLVQFLRDQNAITKLDAPGLSSRYRLGPPVLPGLRTICGTAGLLRRVVPGRPVDSVRCTSPVANVSFFDLVGRLQQSSCPLKEFIFPSVFLTAARDYLPILANNFPSLESLVMSDRTPTFLSGTENMNPYEMYKEEAFLHALSKFADLRDLTVYGKPLTSARLALYNPTESTPSAPPVNSETEASSIFTASDVYDGDGDDYVDMNDVGQVPGELQDDISSPDADVQQDGMLHANVLQPPSQPGIPVSVASSSGPGPFTSNPAAANDALEPSGLDPPPTAETTSNAPLPALNQMLDVFGPPLPDSDIVNIPAGDVAIGNASHTTIQPSAPYMDLANDETHPQLANANHPPLPQPLAQPNPVTDNAQQPGPPPQNANGGAGINVTFGFGPGINPPELGEAFLQQIQAVTAQIVNQLAVPLGNALQPTVQNTAPPQEDVDVDMILDDDPPNFGDFGGLLGNAGPGPVPELPPGAVFGGAVHIDAVLQLGPLPGGHPTAAFPAGIPPVPAPQLHTGLPPNNGVVLPPLPHAPAAAGPPWAAAFPPHPGIHHIVVLNPGPLGGGVPNMPAPAPAGDVIENATNIPPPLPQLLQGINALHNNFGGQQYREQRRRIDTFQRDQASEERAVLTLWSAYCPSLQRVTFEMDAGRHVIWKRRGQVWKPSYTPSGSQSRKKNTARSTPTRAAG